MTGGTTRQHLRRLNVIFSHPLLASRNFFRRRILLRPRHVKNFFPRPHKVFRIPVTTETPLHLQRRSLVGDWHLIDAAVTGRTTDPFVYMNTVIEVGVIRQVVNPDPLDWLARAKARAYRLQIGAL